jgi:hypothetical protein
LYPALRESAAAYDWLPSETPPNLALRWSLPRWLPETVRLLTALAFCGMGLCTALLVRPRDRAADIAAGLIAGLLAGITAVVISGASLGVMLWSVKPVEQDLARLAASSWPVSAPGRPSPADALLQKYPDLERVPPARRGAILYHKVRVDLLAGIPVGLWVGTFMALVFGGAVGALHTAAAGRAIRRYGPGLGAVLPYLEVALPVLGLLGVPMRLADNSARGFFRGQGWLVLLFVLLTLSVTGALRGWPWWVRVGLAALWLTIVSLLIVAVF